MAWVTGVTLTVLAVSPVTGLISCALPKVIMAADSAAAPTEVLLKRYMMLPSRSWHAPGLKSVCQLPKRWPALRALSRTSVGDFRGRCALRQEPDVWLGWRPQRR